MRTFSFLAALACALLAVGAPASRAASDTIVFGAAESLTGPLAKEGRLEQEGYDFWKDYVNAHGGLTVAGKRYQVAIKYYDDESNPQTAARLVEKLIDEDKVSFILGPYGSSPSFSAAAVCERKHVPMVEGNGTSEKIFEQGYRYVFLVGAPAKKYLWGTIEMSTKRDPKPRTAAIVAANDTFSLEVQQGAVENANDHGLRVVYSARYSPTATDLSTIASAIKAAAPDIILNAGHLQDALLLQKTLKEQNVGAKLYAYSVGPDTPDFVAALGRDANYVFSAAQWSESVRYAGAPGFITNAREYARLYTARYGHRPDYHSADATASGLAYQYALASAGSLDPTKVRDALSGVDVVTFYGLIKFDSRGVNVWKPMVVNQIQNGKLVTVYPYRLGDAPPMYPAPDWSAR
jgi:branched-chain amino acid transport system substrate-binding protein